MVTEKAPSIKEFSLLLGYALIVQGYHHLIKERLYLILKDLSENRNVWCEKVRYPYHRVVDGKDKGIVLGPKYDVSLISSILDLPLSESTDLIFRCLKDELGRERPGFYGTPSVTFKAYNNRESDVYAALCAERPKLGHLLAKIIASQVSRR